MRTLKRISNSLGILSSQAGIATTAVFCAALIGSAATAAEPRKLPIALPPLPEAIIILPGSEMPAQTALSSVRPAGASADFPVISSETIVPSETVIFDSPEPSLGMPVGCEDGNCPVYHRRRPHDIDEHNRHMMLRNRANEPGWYRNYRRDHYGYYPTQWATWPEGWLNCRNPAPGSHRYDWKPGQPCPTSGYVATPSQMRMSPSSQPAAAPAAVAPTPPPRRTPAKNNN